MRIINLKRAIMVLLMVGILTGVSGCARWPNGPGPEPGTEYQLQITVQVLGELNIDDGIYYIVLDNNGNSTDGPGEEVDGWNDDYYYVQLDDWGFYFAQVEEGSASISLTASSYSEDKLQVTIAISDLEDPNSVDINVLTTDSDNNTYDSLDSGYFSINATVLGSKPPIDDWPDDSGDGGADFDIVKVTAVITTLY